MPGEFWKCFLKAALTKTLTSTRLDAIIYLKDLLR